MSIQLPGGCHRLVPLTATSRGVAIAEVAPASSPQPEEPSERQNMLQNAYCGCEGLLVGHAPMMGCNGK